MQPDAASHSTAITPSAGYAALKLAERLLDRLKDPARRDRTAAVLLIVYAALWTLYAVIAKSSQDIHFDMSEQFVLGRELALGYDKHPPLTMLIVRLWFAAFPAADWSYYLLAMVNSALALWIIWRLSERYLDSDKRVIGLALLTFVPFFNFHALKFNPNTILMPLWALTTLAFLRSFETRRPLDAALAGLFAAAAMYGKYWSVVLLLGLVIAAVTDSRRAHYFRSPAPWITVLVGAGVIAPHVVWLVANHFAPFSYAVLVHGDAPAESALQSAFAYLIGSVAYVSAPLLIVISLSRPDREALGDMAWPRGTSRRFAATVFWSSLLLPALIAPAVGVRLTSLWSMSSWALLPTMLLSSPLIAIAQRHAVRILMAAAVFPLVMVAVAPLVAFALHETNDGSEGHSSLLAKPVHRLWADTTNEPLKVFGSTGALTYDIPFYLAEHPIAVHVLETSPSAQEEALIEKSGVALVCPINETICIKLAKMRVAQSPFANQTEVDVSRSFLWSQGSSGRYLVIAIPPKPPST